MSMRFILIIIIQNTRFVAIREKRVHSIRWQIVKLVRAILFIKINVCAVFEHTKAGFSRSLPKMWPCQSDSAFNNCTIFIFIQCAHIYSVLFMFYFFYPWLSNAPTFMACILFTWKCFILYKVWNTRLFVRFRYISSFRLSRSYPLVWVHSFYSFLPHRGITSASFWLSSQNYWNYTEFRPNGTFW